MSRPDTYCPLPWQHLATHPHGGVTTCCISDHTNGLNRARNFKGEHDEFLSLNKETIEPFSYTHLTLPTKRIV